ncbi:uncharacterized protein LOC121417740 [Lytechinus variegatus]|uniref:uncharacterized protein LOC121417740 n=1 Tax=Lytechinus variegatus TaxID=7654 RepID=UPI001BB20DE1|nr:uncharacterized protein LOC121417740 [Lytechinus variegatus]
MPLRITKCRLSSEMISRMWPCLRSFNSLKHLTISDASLSFPPSPTELPSVTKLSVKGVTSQSYNGLISSLPGLESIDITMDDEEGDIARYIVVLRRTAGQKLKHIYLYGPSSWSSLLRNRGIVSREAIRGLGLFIEEHTKNLVSLYLECVECTDENHLVYLIDCCRRVKTMKRVE